MMKRQHSPKAIIPEAISRLKQRAREIKRERGLLHHEALEVAASEAGYPNWHIAMKAAHADPANNAQHAMTEKSLTLNRHYEALALFIEWSESSKIDFVASRVGHQSQQATKNYLKSYLGMSTRH